MVMHLRQLVHRASIAAVATAGGRPTFVPIAHATTRRLTSPLFFSSSSTAQQAPPTRYLLSYDYVPDVLEKRGPYREGHLGLAKAMIEGGTCVSGGPTSRPGEDVPKGALFVFTTKDAAEKFVAEDPYVSNGIVVGHSISEWTVVVGDN